jgi:cobalamin biosynthesis protein CobT
MKKEYISSKHTTITKNNQTKKEYKVMNNSFDSSLKSHSIMDENRKGRIHAFSTLSYK